MLKNECRVISVSATKGGVGKTTTVVNLAKSLIDLDSDNKVLIIDMDAQANASQMVLYESDAYYDNCLSNLLTDSVGNIILNINDILSAIQIPCYSKQVKEGSQWVVIDEPFGFDILPTMIGMQLLELAFTRKSKNILINNYEAELMLSNIVDLIKKHLDYNYILIDTPPSMGIFTINALMASDYVIIPSSKGLFSIKGIEYTESLIKTLVDYRDKDIKILGILLSSFRESGQADIYTKKTIYANYPEIPLFHTKIPYTAEVDNKLIEGMLVCQKHAGLKRRYKELALEVIYNIEHYDEIQAALASRTIEEEE
ncbi:MAG: AAA family ATPase [Erysipelotrichaceae bacterium]